MLGSQVAAQPAAAADGGFHCGSPGALCPRCRPAGRRGADMKRYWVYLLLALSLLVNAGVLAGAWYQPGTGKALPKSRSSAWATNACRIT